MFQVNQQTIRIEDGFGDDDLILDLGGGGEGVIGQLRGRQVVAIDTRRQELEECASGPLKVVADATDLPFLDNAFDAITAFFFLMYVPAAGRASVLREARRVLRQGGVFHIWDAEIPPRDGRTQQLFVVPVRAELPDRTIQTGYGVRWDGSELSVDAVAQLAQEAGFTVDKITRAGAHFQLTLT
ncbi:methyltransferase domain-containing protein [Candidatus Bipolaricaulota bacterium]|nr:methyltransferase domain-containing protein [Candidatus Bipolaricaulota bacterium]